MAAIRHRGHALLWRRIEELAEKVADANWRLCRAEDSAWRWNCWTEHERVDAKCVDGRNERVDAGVLAHLAKAEASLKDARPRASFVAFRALVECFG